MVFVAAHGESGVLPRPELLRPGMLAIFCSCLSFLLFGFIEKCMTMNFINGWRGSRGISRGCSASELLLGPDAIAEKVSSDSHQRPERSLNL